MDVFESYLIVGCSWRVCPRSFDVRKGFDTFRDNASGYIWGKVCCIRSYRKVTIFIDRAMKLATSSAKWPTTCRKWRAGLVVTSVFTVRFVVLGRSVLFDFSFFCFLGRLKTLEKDETVWTNSNRWPLVACLPAFIWCWKSFWICSGQCERWFVWKMV